MRSTYSRAMSISMRDSAIQSWMSPFWATSVPNVVRCSARLTMHLERPLGHADGAHAVVDAARARGGPGEMAKPPPSSPRRLSAGTRTSS